MNNHKKDMCFKEIAHKVPGPKSQITLGQTVQSSLLRAWKLGLTTSQRVPSPSPKYDMNTYMTTLFEGEMHDLC
jgi:hypothetical protein